MPNASLREPLPGGTVPEPMEIFHQTMKEFLDDPGPYLLAGLGQIVILTPLLFMGIFLIYFGMAFLIFGGMAVGGVISFFVTEMAGEDAGEVIFAIISMGTILVAWVCMVIIGMLLSLGGTLLQASLLRRVAEHQRGGRPLDFTASFTDIRINTKNTALISLLTMTVILIGSLLCYLPGLIAFIALLFAFPLVVLHNVSPMQAATKSLAHSQENLAAHAKMSLLYFGLLIIGSYIPVAGPIFALAYHTRAYRTLYGDGDETAVPARR